MKLGENYIFWKTVFIKGVVIMGFTFFSVCATMGFIDGFKPAFVAGGLYIFAEAVKYYNLQPSKKVNNKTYSFLI